MLWYRNCEARGEILKRTQVRRLLIVAVMLALSSLGFFVGRTIISQQAADAERQSRVELEPDVSQRIEHFRRVKVKDGRKVWELTAQEAEYLTEQGQVVVASPKLAFYSGDGRDIQVRGKEGHIFLTDGNVQRIEVSGGIEVTVGEYFVATEKAIYFENINSIIAPGEVNLKSAELALAGNGMMLELNEQRVRFLRGVTTTFQGSHQGDASEERVSDARYASRGGAGAPVVAR